MKDQEGGRYAGDCGGRDLLGLVMSGELLEARLERFGRVSTIDVRVDFLRPGIGNCFVPATCVLRTGKKIAVMRTELHNDRNDLIAVGTGSYIMA